MVPNSRWVQLVHEHPSASEPTLQIMGNWIALYKQIKTEPRPCPSGYSTFDLFQLKPWHIGLTHRGATSRRWPYARATNLRLSAATLASVKPFFSIIRTVYFGAGKTRPSVRRHLWDTSIKTVLTARSLAIRCVWILPACTENWELSCMRPISQIPQCTCPYPTMHHYRIEMCIFLFYGVAF